VVVVLADTENCLHKNFQLTGLIQSRSVVAVLALLRLILAPVLMVAILYFQPLHQMAAAAALDRGMEATTDYLGALGAVEVEATRPLVQAVLELLGKVITVEVVGLTALELRLLEVEAAVRVLLVKMRPEHQLVETADRELHLQ
jgi:hypothetical protein